MSAGAGVYPVPDEGVTEGWAPSAAPLSTNEPIGAGDRRCHLAVTFDNKEKSCVKHTAVAQLLEQLLSARLIDSTLQPPRKGTPEQIVSIQSHLANMDDASA